MSSPLTIWWAHQIKCELTSSNKVWAHQWYSVSSPPTVWWAHQWWSASPPMMKRAHRWWSASPPMKCELTSELNANSKVGLSVIKHECAITRAWAHQYTCHELTRDNVHAQQNCNLPPNRKPDQADGSLTPLLIYLWPVVCVYISSPSHICS